jgi:hypothetical protein
LFANSGAERHCSLDWLKMFQAEVDGAETPEASNGNAQFCLRRDIHIFIAAIVTFSNRIRPAYRRSGGA